MSDSSTIFIAKETFVTHIDGQEVIVHKGVTRVRAGHKLLRGKAELFEPLKIHYDVEQATAAPAEKRAEPKPAPKVTPVETAAKDK